MEKVGALLSSQSIKVDSPRYKPQFGFAEESGLRNKMKMGTKIWQKWRLGELRYKFLLSLISRLF